MFKIKKGGKSLLSFLKEKTGLSGREIKRALEQGACLLNGKIERFASTKLAAGDALTFRLPKKQPEESYTLLYQDRSLSVFNKPAGLITAPQKGYHLVHRLDKGTSGVLLMARTLPMKKDLETLFRKKTIRKTYIALVKGIPRKLSGTLHNRLGKKGAFHGQTLYGSCPNGKEAITHYKLLKKGKGSALLELQPETGRTHQLRVHLSELGHPILGDLLYGRETSFPKEVDRLYLHAYRLVFLHPATEKRLQVTAPLPKLFNLD